MPNWCDNTLTIRGNKETIQKFIESSVEVEDNKQTWLRLGKLHPAPEEDWYDWRIANWGCKWECEIYNMDVTDEYAKIYFSSPWSPPCEWIDFVSKRFFPDLHFRLSFIETGVWFCGMIEGQNGNFEGTQGEIITTDEDGIVVEFDSDQMLYRYTSGSKDYLDEDFTPQCHNSCDYE